MVSQSFQYGDLGKVALLVLLEGLLSADNALILAIIVRHLPKELQKKALFYGLGGAFVFRMIAIVSASMLVGFWWIQLIGAAYLIFLPVKHFISKAGEKHVKGKAGTSFWMTVLYAELADIAFAIDSVLVAVAIEPHPDKIWVVYFGAIIGVVLLRFAATGFLRLLERFPALDHMAYVLVGWAGVKLLFLGLHTLEKFLHDSKRAELPFHVPELSPAVFWGGLVLIVAVGSFVAFRNPAEPEPEPALEVTDEPEEQQLLEPSDA